jgi:hypothetical protein
MTWRLYRFFEMLNVVDDYDVDSFGDYKYMN